MLLEFVIFIYFKVDFELLDVLVLEVWFFWSLKYKIFFGKLIFNLLFIYGF